MPVSAIPFNMPDPAEIPAHIIDQLRAAPGAQAVEQGMKLLLQIDAAETMIYERVDADGKLSLVGVVGQDDARADQLQRLLSQAEIYKDPLSPAQSGLAGLALEQNSALLVMGQAEEEEEAPLTAQLKAFLLDGGRSGNIGFIYVLPFIGQQGQPLGALSLLRPAATGPLNHEQPNITEGLRRVLNEILER